MASIVCPDPRKYNDFLTLPIRPPRADHRFGQPFELTPSENRINEAKGR